MKAEDHGKFIESVHSRTRELIDRLLDENRKLQTLAESLSNENEILGLRLNALEQELAQRSVQQKELESRLHESQITGDSLRSQYTDVEQQNMKLANLYVASYQLHATYDRSGVLVVIQEILANLIGTEDFAIYEFRTPFLALAHSMGSRELDEKIRIGSGAIGSSVNASGVTITNPRSVEGEETPLVTIPLRFADDLVGAIVIFTFLPQKSKLEQIDEELFDLLATHAATALYCSSVHDASSSQGADA